MERRGEQAEPTIEGIFGGEEQAPRPARPLPRQGAVAGRAAMVAPFLLPSKISGHQVLIGWAWKGSG